MKLIIKYRLMETKIIIIAMIKTIINMGMIIITITKNITNRKTKNNHGIHGTNDSNHKKNKY